MTATGSTLLIIIVNYRTPDLTVACLRSLSRQVHEVPSVQVVVVDNASEDDSVSQITTAIQSFGWESWVHIHQSPVNGGFACGNNRGFELFPQSKYVLLLNSDTCVHDGCLKKCIELMERERSIGALSCRVLNQDGSNQNVCRRFPSPLRMLASAFGLPYRFPRFFEWADTEDPNWDRAKEARDVDWIGGAFMFLRGDLIRQIGLLDESFYFYGEDIEICHRIWKAGFRVHYDPSSAITHLGGASSDPTRLPEEKRTDHRWQARYLVQRQCYGRFAERMVRTLDLNMYRLRILKHRFFERGKGQSYASLRDALATLKRLPKP